MNMEGNIPQSEVVLESEILAKGLNAPRLTPDHIENCIAAEYYGRASHLFRDAPSHTALECLTICTLVTKSGFTLVGTSACASPENYDPDIGRKLARQNAREQLWKLEGYLLKERLSVIKD